MVKYEVYQKELTKLQTIFADVEESKRKLVEGLMEDAAFLLSENMVLKELMAVSGMVKTHPLHPEMQKPLETSKQYIKNIGAYSIVIKTLNGTPTSTPTILLGDTTGDGKITSADALKILQSITGKVVLTDIQKIAADVTKNGVVQSSDALKVLQYCSGKITSF